MRASKPHLSFARQLELLEDRGMSIADRGQAGTWLRKIGYYRLSAYWYPFRVPLPEGHPKETPHQHRADRFFPGTNLDDIVKLYNFDRKLRLVCLDGLELLEVGIRVQVGHVLGERDPLAHLDRSHLNEEACSERKNGALDVHDQWLARFDKHKSDARTEDFVAHHFMKYEGNLPVWAATEIMDFGSVVRLFSLMTRTDQNHVARELGVNDGIRLHKWLLGLNNLRNVCAHHSRLWNRSMPYPLSRVPKGMTGPELDHLAAVTLRQKLYARAAVLAYLIRRIDPYSRWPSQFVTHVRKLPADGDAVCAAAMGCPEGWDSQTLWAHKPPI